MKFLVNSPMLMNFVWDFVNSGIHSVLLWIDSVIYWFASQCYQLFIKLAGAKIFEDSFFANFANRIYVVLGVFMLFYLAYALLNALVDPEKLTKGDKGAGKIATNLIVSLVILGFLPTIFNYAYRLQNYVLASNVIGSLILGTPPQDVNTGTNNNGMLNYGDVLSFTILNTFLNSENINFNVADNYTWYDFKADVIDNGDYSAMPNMGKAVSTGVSALNGTYAGSTVRIDYKVVISTAAGVFLIYIMLSFTLDLGVRVAKFAFYQLIAPIPVIMRILPSKKGTFDKWLKQTLSVYFEVFVRVAIMYIAIYFINEIVNTDTLSQFWNGGIQGKLALVIIILGILTFAKQAPKMISDMLGIDTGGLKLGIKDKLKAGGFFAAGAAIGAGATGLIRNSTNAGANIFRNGRNAINSFKNGDIKGGFQNVGGALASTFAAPLSMVAGATSGMYNALQSGKDAKNFGDMKKAASAGAKASTENRGKRESYRASHGGPVGSMLGHMSDMGSNLAEFAGVNMGLESLKEQQSKAGEVKNARKAIDDKLEAILNKNKNVYQSRQTYSLAGQQFTNYADLLNEIDIMKSTGKTSRGQTVTAQMLTEAANKEHQMKENMKQDILAGYNLKDGNHANGLGGKYTVSEMATEYDAELKELIAAFRTKSLQHASLIFQNASDAYSDSIKQFETTAVNNKNLSLEDFILQDNEADKDSNGISKSYVESLFISGKDAINSANTELGQRVAQRIEVESKKQGK